MEKETKEHPLKKSLELASAATAGSALSVLEPSTVKHEESGAYGAQRELSPERKPRRMTLKELKDSGKGRSYVRRKLQDELEKQGGY